MQQIEEIYNFSQDDLLTEDILILDTHLEVFVWVGQSVDSKEKQTAFDIGQKYIELASTLDGLSPTVPLYRVSEGNEPNFFTTFFSWDSAKANAHGNSFQKKILLMFGFGGGHAAEGGPTQRASTLAALNSAFQSSPTTKSSASPKAPTRGSQRAAAVAALFFVLTAEKKGPSDAYPFRPVRSPPSESSSPAIAKSEEPSASSESNEGSEVTSETSEQIQETNGEESAPKSTTDENECESVDSQSTFSYEQLKAKSENPVTGIDFKRREANLSAEEFEAVLGVTKEAFYKIPKWKQDMMKKKVDLF
ncbi:villin headpiece, Villin/Gelsolin, ADF-H/Gelsolin-like domain protein [Artemisia annua]|uniref:Villin headpiece, Villin/Gelsolin, ADF-H/Gelsolin-like domain protein n=1 Tax=Artemisia annua TaxID=35608 RepID=A0A2U1PL17_ARTAN|nr:villin headpiece, Villin/Gelsolin, ADF-H/Gelsolin-like domain protein [Artemisia annua]